MNREMDERQQYRRRWERLKLFTGGTVIAFAVMLAVIVGNRLSDEALAVLAGAVCGVGAAIPTSLLVVFVSRRRDENRRRQSSVPASSASYPPVVVVAPPGSQQRNGAWNTFSPALNAPTQRRFTVVGDPAIETEMATYER